MKLNETQLSEELCYRAVQSRDPRFDGRFFTAVLTTRIYCRPICPARTPSRAHVRFYSCAAAAEQAGFRPCRRCRPDAAPGSAAWIGTSATVVRGLRCIAEGALDEAGVEDLALRLGLGERQLRRLFLRHLGASPNRLALTRRVHFARKLIDESVLPMTEVAFAAGFSSLRQFNDAVKTTFGRNPTELRTRGRVGAREGPLSLRLPFRSPFDWDSLIGFLQPRAIPGVERVDSLAYARGFEINGQPYRLEVQPNLTANQILLVVQPPPPRGLGDVVARIRSLFDLEADPISIDGLLERSPEFKRLVRTRPGLRVPGAWNGFELAVRAILGQQITVAGATTLAGRMARTFGSEFSWPEKGITHFFPSPETLAEADLTRIGLTRTRSRAIRILAREVATGRLQLSPSSPVEETRARLHEIPGLGPWTIEYVALRVLRDPDAFPSSDLGLRRAMALADRLPSPAELARRSEAWRPWRSYAAMHLWRSLGSTTRRKHVRAD